MTADPRWRSRMAGYPVQPRASYALSDVDLMQAVELPDIVPAAGQDSWARALALEATVYGLPAVYRYVQMHATALDRTNPSYVGFNSFRHERTLAGPGYSPFRTPNVDTLYSHAWLDLSRGPVEVTVPAMEGRYYTVHLLDAYSNATNLSTRTWGPDGGTVWLATPEWEGSVPDGVPVFRVASPYLWVLLRIFVRGAADLPAVHALQDAVALTPTAAGVGAPPRWLSVPADAESLDATTFLAVLDLCLTLNGHPVQEDALVYRLRGLGIGGIPPLDPQEWSAELRASIERGFAEAMDLIRGVREQRGEPAGTSGWRTLRSGAYGFNYLHRAATNYVGLGATVREESGAYTTFVDEASEPLVGSRSYRLRLAPPPPVEAFWSLTAYDVETRELVTNRMDRFVVNSETTGLSWGADGSIEVILASDEPVEGRSNWLPVPKGRFYLVIRAYLGGPEIVDGTWTPPGVVPEGDRA